jgi:hypothetical protein
MPGSPTTPKPPVDLIPVKPMPSPPAPSSTSAPPLPELIPPAPTPGGSGALPEHKVKPMPVTPPSPAVAPMGVEIAPPITNVSPPSRPVASPPIVGVGGTQPSAPVAAPPAGPDRDPLRSGHGTPSVGSGDPPGQPAFPDLPASRTSPPPLPPIQQAPTDSKFRLVLRVGEGEPTFEVKNGDNLVLKVACEKVDIKSPDKGGLSEVTARGKVRFAGFGAEGTCEELKFFAGTGEVSMSGDVKVVVRDKLGRVESELTSTTLKYKIDANAVGGQIKP